MTLGDIIREYRKTTGKSMDVFAKESGLSKGYISMLEKNRHPKTGNPIIPTLETLKKCAAAMRMGLDDLLSRIDADFELPQSDTPPVGYQLNRKEEILLREFNKLNQAGQDKIIREVAELTCSPLYNYHYKAAIATHARIDKEFSSQDRAHDLALMMDDHIWE